MVWGVCRRLLHNHHDAEDAFQATFVVLVRKAASIVPRKMVGNWLYGVARQTALKARATSAKRRERERQQTEMPEPTVPEQGPWPHLWPLLDQELSLLPDKYRVVIILCDLEGKSRHETARHLDCPEGTVASRLARARTMLAKRLARHGLGVGATLAAVLAENVASAWVQTSAMSATIKAVTSVTAGQAATSGWISVKVAALTEGVLKAMVMAKLKKVAAVLLVLCISACAGRLLTRQSASGQEAKAEPVLRQNTDQSRVSADQDDRMPTPRVGLEVLHRIKPGMERKDEETPTKRQAEATKEDDGAWANKLFAERTKEFGDCTSGAQLKHRFKLTNIYAVPLEITQIRVSCECVACSPSKQTLQSKESAYLDVTMDSTRFSGAKRVSIHVTVGQNYSSTATLTVSANSLPR